jgi:parallel beta-helix repeat protein
MRSQQLRPDINSAGLSRRAFMAAAAAWGQCLDAGRLALGAVPAAEPRSLAARLAWVPAAPAQAPPTGDVIRVVNVNDLLAAAERVRPHGTILVADGHYRLPRYVELRGDGVTLRGESGRRDRVVLDGEGRLRELLGVGASCGATIADVTVQNVQCNGIKVNANRGARRVTVYNCVLHNVWQRGIKGPSVPREQRGQLPPSACTVQYCLFTNDRPKRWEDDPADTPRNFRGNYVGGMDIMYAHRWTISDNVFAGIQGRTREGRGAIFLWEGAEDCIVERNVIVDCDNGICLGNSSRAPQTTIHCTGCVVRNNFVTRCPEAGLLADHTRDCRIVHNTVHEPDSRLGRLIRVVHDNPGLVVASNLLDGPPPRVQTTDAVRLEDNISGPRGTFFVNPRDGDLHLRAGAEPTRAARLAEAAEDFDRESRPARTAVGADEPTGRR